LTALVISVVIIIVVLQGTKGVIAKVNCTVWRSLSFEYCRNLQDGLFIYLFLVLKIISEQEEDQSRKLNGIPVNWYVKAILTVHNSSLAVHKIKILLTETLVIFDFGKGPSSIQRRSVVVAAEWFALNYASKPSDSTAGYQPTCVFV